MKNNMMALAEHIIAYAQDNNLAITNLQLQKVLYFTLKDAINNEDYTKEELKNIYDEKFEVWRYGPVEREIYNRFKVYVANPISASFSESSFFNKLNKYIDKYIEQDPYDLVIKSHEESFWIDNKNSISDWTGNVKYSLENVKYGK